MFFYSYRLDFLKHVLRFRKASLIHEMAKSLNIEINQNSNMSHICQILRKYYLDELCFLNDLPHVLEDEEHIYVHAGIESNENYGTDFKQVMTHAFFLETNQYSEKKSHCWTYACNRILYHIASFDPIYDAKHNIYSIDGGNMVKYGGQLNALIFEENKVKMERCDLLNERKVIQDVNYSSPNSLFYNI